MIMRDYTKYSNVYVRNATEEEQKAGVIGNSRVYGMFATIKEAKEKAIERGFVNPLVADCDYMVIRNNKTGKIVFTMAKGVML